jgi:hypothetical protein
MNNRIFSLIIATGIGFFSLNCSQTTTTLPQEPAITVDNLSEENDALQSKDLSWLNYADPKADANLAIEKQDFTLLAFAGRATSFPGIESESSILQQQCGYRLLANSSDALRSQSELHLRKKLYQYAATFNQLVAAACQKQ